MTNPCQRNNMTEYYLDIETYSPNERPDPAVDKIITIQYQKLSKSGAADGDLRILTEWDCGSEKNMLDEFRRTFITESDFDFIPVGMNIYGFVLIAIISRLNHHFALNLGLEFYRNRPVIDIKPTLVMMNGGRLKGYSEVLGKSVPGSMIKEWYEKGDHASILKYVADEADNFVRKYQALRDRIMKIQLQTVS